MCQRGWETPDHCYHPQGRGFSLPAAAPGVQPCPALLTPLPWGCWHYLTMAWTPRTPKPLLTAQSGLSWKPWIAQATSSDGKDSVNSLVTSFSGFKDPDSGRVQGQVGWGCRIPKDLDWMTHLRGRKRRAFVPPALLELD